VYAAPRDPAPRAQAATCRGKRDCRRPAKKEEAPHPEPLPDHIGNVELLDDPVIGPIGNRTAELFWWVTVPRPNVGFHIDMAAPG